MKGKDKLIKRGVRYTIIPNQAFSMGLGPISMCVYSAICGYSEDFNPTLSYLSRHLGFHRNSIVTALKELCNVGMLNKLVQGRVFRVAGMQCPDSSSYQSIYEMVPVNEWLAPIAKANKLKVVV